MTEAVSAGWVIPVDGPPIENGYVAWEDGRIVEVGQGRVDRHYGEDALILPGIVNAHSHLEYSVYAGFGDGQPFGSWLATHILRKRVLTRDDMVAIASHGAAQSLAAGITTTADYSFSGAAADAAAALGLRAIVYLEVFGSDPDAAAARFADLRAGIAETELMTVGISPHAPYTCSLDVYRYCLSLGIPVGTHLAESDGENEWLEHGTGPLSAAEDVLVAPTGKRAVERSTRCSAPTCSAPTASRSTRARSPRWRRPTCRSRTARARTRCSGAASRLSPDFATRGCESASAQTRRRPPPRSTRGTRCGRRSPGPARASGGRTRSRRRTRFGSRRSTPRPRSTSTNEVGSLTPGKRADLTVLSVAGSPYVPIEDPSAAVVYSGTPAGVLATLVEGKMRYRQEETAWPEVRSTASAARRRMLA